MIISHSSYNRELLKWQRAGGTVWQDDCWPIDILDECPVNFKAINFNIISAIYSNLVWLYFNEDKLPKMIGNSDWYIRISSEFTPRTFAHQETWSMTTDVFHIGHPTSLFSFNLHSVGAWWRPRGLQLLNGSCFFDTLQQSPLKISEILSFINQKGNGKEMKARLQARHPNPKYTPENLHGVWRSPL